MDISFDSAKSEKNVLVRGISSELAAGFEWVGALVVEDLRKGYGERRFQALGLIENRLHKMVFTPRANKAHVISLRKAKQTRGQTI
jgi:uncharacterized DUF497 family protein